MIFLKPKTPLGRSRHFAQQKLGPVLIRWKAVGLTANSFY
jgi:hypothetical protein